MDVCFFFYRDKATRETALAWKPSAEKHYNKAVYFPEKFEKMTSHETKRFQRRYNLRYVWFFLKNRRFVFQADSFDYYATRARLTDASLQLSLIGLMACALFKARRILNQHPILNYLQTFRVGRRNLNVVFPLMMTGLAYEVWLVYSKLRNDEFLYFTGLKYKEFVAPGELESPNCEDTFRMLQEDLLKIYSENKSGQKAEK